MAILDKKSILSDAVSSWLDRGLLETNTAEILIADIDSMKSTSGFAFKNILILLAVICLGFGAMTFVAANWEDMSRLTRVGLIFGSMWAFWGGSVWFHMRGNDWFAQVLTLGACAMFGAGIMLISQLYHIQGSPKDATWLWAVGTLFAAAVTRSIPALGLAIVLLMVWVFIEPNMFHGFWGSRERLFQLEFPIYMAICAGLAYWMASRFCAHLVVLALCVWAIPMAITLADDGFIFFFMATMATGFIILSFMLFSDQKHNWLRGFERATSFYMVTVVGISIFSWYLLSVSDWGVGDLIINWSVYSVLAVFVITICSVLAIYGWKTAHPNTYDLVVCACFSAAAFFLILFFPVAVYVYEALMLAGSIWIIRMGWRIEYRPIAVIGFVAFALVMLLIYMETIGSLLGTSMFYLIAGGTLLVGIIVIPRLTRKTGEI